MPNLVLVAAAQCTAGDGVAGAAAAAKLDARVAAHAHGLLIRRRLGGVPCATSLFKFRRRHTRQAVFWVATAAPLAR